MERSLTCLDKLSILEVLLPTSGKVRRCGCVFGSMYDSFSSTNTMIRSSPACSRKKITPVDCNRNIIQFSFLPLVNKTKSICDSVDLVCMLLCSTNQAPFSFI